MAEKKESAARKPLVAAKAASKSSINLAPNDKVINWKVTAPVLAVVILLLACLAKFGILDPLSKKTAAYNDLSAKQAQLAQLNATLAENADVEADYGRYSYGWLTESERAAIDRMDIIDLLDAKVAAAAKVKNFSVSGDVVTMNLTGVSLEKASKICEDLEADDLVESASIFSANSAKKSHDADILLSVKLAAKEAE